MFVFFFNVTATPQIYTLSLHDALPILRVKKLMPICSYSLGHQRRLSLHRPPASGDANVTHRKFTLNLGDQRSEEHTSELQSLTNLVCRLLLEKKKKKTKTTKTKSEYTK